MELRERLKKGWENVMGSVRRQEEEGMYQKKDQLQEEDLDTHQEL